MLLRGFVTLLTLMCMPSVAFATDASTWSLTSTLIDSKEGGQAFHQLEFKQGSTTLKYAPQKPPLGLVSKKQYALDGKIYFVTGWAHGPSTVLYRVFAPSVSKDAVPLCEAPSLSEKAELKVFGSEIKISTYLKESAEVTWVKCAKRPKK